MVRTRRDEGPERPNREDGEARKALLSAYAKVADSWGFGGLRDGLLARGWTDDDLCWVIDQGYAEGRCEIGALTVAGYLLGLRGKGPDALRRAAADNPATGGYPKEFYPVPPPPDATERAAWERKHARTAKRRRRAERRERATAR